MTQNKKSTRYYSQQQEKYVAKISKGTTVTNSGATPYRKGDVATSKLLIECKTSTCKKQSFSIKKQWLDTIKNESIQQGKEGFALAFNFGPGTENYYIISESKFQEICSEG